MNKRAYAIVIEWPNYKGKKKYSILWQRQAHQTTLADAQAALAQAQVGWPNKGRNKGRKIFLCSPLRAQRLGAR